MSFKKHNWLAYGHNTNIIVELKLKDSFGGTMDFFRCNNKKDFQRIAKILKDKYGLGLND